MPILHDDLSIRLGENRPDQSSQTFCGYEVNEAYSYNSLNVK